MAEEKEEFEELNKCDKRTLRPKTRKEKQNGKKIKSTSQENFGDTNINKTIITPSNKDTKLCSDLDKFEIENVSEIDDTLNQCPKMNQFTDKKSCIICKKSLSSKCVVNRHIKLVHFKLRSHSCPYLDCKTISGTKSDLRSHINKCHKKAIESPF